MPERPADIAFQSGIDRILARCDPKSFKEAAGWADEPFTVPLLASKLKPFGGLAEIQATMNRLNVEQRTKEIRDELDKTILYGRKDPVFTNDHCHLCGAPLLEHTTHRQLKRYGTDKAHWRQTDTRRYACGTVSVATEGKMQRRVTVGADCVQIAHE